jgi:opacity protein-like surface antigen
MRNVKVWAALLGVFGMLQVSTVWAQDDYDRQGAYVGVGFAYGLSNFGLGDVEDAVSGIVGRPVELSAGDAPGFDIRGGYRLHPHIAVEGQFQYFTSFSMNIDRVGDLNVNEKFADLDTFAFGANVKGYALTGRIQPYGLLGIGMMLATLNPRAEGVDSETDVVFGARFGAGADFYLTDNILLVAEVSYLLPTSDYKFGGEGPGVNGAIIPVVVGAQYRF